VPYRPLRALPMSGVMGWLYLAALDEPIAHALHYRGWTLDNLSQLIGARHDDPGIETRLRSHASGQGARLLAVARERGIGWTIVWTAPGDRNEERRLKGNGQHARRDCATYPAALPPGHRHD